jgi:hypothetical protein
LNGAVPDTVASPPPTKTSPLPALLLESLLLDSPLLLASLLLASPLLLDAPLGAPPAEALLSLALLVVAPPPAPLALDEPDVGAATEPQAESHAPAIPTKAASVASSRRLLSRWNGCFFITTLSLRAPPGHGGTWRSASPTCALDSG